MTVRMQAAYEIALASAREASEAARRTRERRCDDAIASMVTALAASEGGAVITVGGLSSVPAATPTSVDALSAAHRALLEFCAAFVSADSAAAGIAPSPGSPAMTVAAFAAASSRESFAAVESVFPRSALASLRGASADALGAHASDVARLALGVRLFNFAKGRGGTGLEDVPSRGASEARLLLGDVSRTLTGALAAANAYVDVWAAVASPAAHDRVAPSVTALGDAPAGWPVELANRRAFAVLAAAVAEDVRAAEEAAREASESWTAAVRSLDAAVGGASRAPKEVVYPLFADAASVWLRAAETRSATRAAATLWAAVSPSAPHQVGTLPAPVAALAAVSLGADARAAASSSLPIRVLTRAATEVAGRSVAIGSPEAAALLSVPLALQGFCPVSLVSPPPGVPVSAPVGALVVGDATHGILLWSPTEGAAPIPFLCASAAAASAFLSAPSTYIHAVRAAALAAPELVHLLQLATLEPPFGLHEASLRHLAQCAGDLAVAAAASAAATATATSATASPVGWLPPEAPAPAPTRTNKNGVAVADAGVATPVHFVDRHIDPSYTFSEWTLRRQALALANVRRCVTHSAQTDGSHFRRDNDSQVYLPRETGMQTNTDVGVSTDRVPIQIVQVRGAREPFVEAAAARVAKGLSALE